MSYLTPQTLGGLPHGRDGTAPAQDPASTRRADSNRDDGNRDDSDWANGERTDGERTDRDWPDGDWPALPHGGRRQVGALCYRSHRGKLELLLITSRDTGRWVIPKGGLMAGLGPRDSAAEEAWEEAGVVGAAQERPTGGFTYAKRLRSRAPVPCRVEVYALRVERLAERFPEKGQRRRRWFTPAKAARKVDEPELAQLMLAFVPPQAGG